MISIYTACDLTQSSCLCPGGTVYLARSVSDEAERSVEGVLQLHKQECVELGRNLEEYLNSVCQQRKVS